MDCQFVTPFEYQYSVFGHFVSMPKVTQRAYKGLWWPTTGANGCCLSTIGAIALSHYRTRRYRTLSEGFR